MAFEPSLNPQNEEMNSSVAEIAMPTKFEECNIGLDDLHISSALPWCGKCCFRIRICKADKRGESLRKIKNQLKMQEKFLTHNLQSLGLNS